MGMGSDSEYAFVKAAITIDGEPFKDEGLRFKGNSSYRMSQDWRGKHGPDTEVW